MIIGLTGGIGAGKTTAARMLAEMGAVVIDTDVIARDVVEPPSPVLDAIVAEFGASVINPDGRLLRAELARMAFSDPHKLQRLNQLTHPAIRARTREEIARQPAGATIVVVVPLLFESGFDRECDAVIAVIADKSARRTRVAARDGLSEAEIDARFHAQLPNDEYERRATVTVHNDGTREQLKDELRAAWEKLTGKKLPD